MQSWEEMDAFQCVDLTDTFVFSWVVSERTLTFEVLASLWPGHPHYEVPPSSDYTCYRKAKLEFLGLTRIDEIAEMSDVTEAIDADGTNDYGCFDFLGHDGKNGYLVVGEFGEINLVCTELRFQIY